MKLVENNKENKRWEFIEPWQQPTMKMFRYKSSKKKKVNNLKFLLPIDVRVSACVIKQHYNKFIISQHYIKYNEINYQ